MNTARLLAGSVLGFFLVEALIFHTNLYPSILSPDSSTGMLESFLHNERRRVVTDRNQVLTIGDSRMGFFPRYSDEMKPPVAYKFATIATPGATPRDWFYMLRDVDPTRRRYSAIVIAMDDYNDPETWEDYANRPTDLHYVIARLGWRDLVEFSASHHDPALQWTAARGIVLKELVYKTDFQDFLVHPKKRLADVRLSRRDSRHWFYEYVGTTDSVKDVRIDWTARQIVTPPGFDAGNKAEFEKQFLAPRAPEHGQHSAYLKQWLGKIYDLYQGSGTRIIFIRLPRGPFLRPDQPPFNANSSVRQLATRPGVILSPEPFFDCLELPELFVDPYHLNGPGQGEFSRMLAKHVEQLLGPPTPQ